MNQDVGLDSLMVALGHDHLSFSASLLSLPPPVPSVFQIPLLIFPPLFFSQIFERLFPTKGQTQDTGRIIKVRAAIQSTSGWEAKGKGQDRRTANLHSFGFTLCFDFLHPQKAGKPFP